jgi:hypothetical protein
MKKVHKYWITLFDYIEDDEYDGDFTENDEEAPRILVQFKMTNEAPKPKQAAPEPVPAAAAAKKHHFQPNTRSPASSNRASQKQSYVSSGSRKSEPRAARPEPVKQERRSPDVHREPDMEDIERFRVSKLKAELLENLRRVIDDLKSEQRELFSEEEARIA